MNLFTNSRARTFRECARKHQLAYVDGWRPVRESEALRFGTLIHTGLEAYWNAIRRWQTDSTNLDTHALDDALAAVNGKAFDAFEQAKADEMLRAYAAKWGTADPLEYEVLAVEAEFRAPLLNPETMAASKTWTLAGKIDAIVRRRSDGRVLIVDNKTSSEEIETDDATMWIKLSMDSQASQYCLGAESMGYAVDELMWNVLKKPLQKPKKATPVEDRKFTKDGALYKTQREFDETPDEYRARVRAVLEEAPDRFLQRRDFPRSNSQLEEHMADAWINATVMRESARLGRSARNPDQCHRFGTCWAWLLCSTGAKPEDYPGEFVKTDNVNPELSKETA